VIHIFYNLNVNLQKFEDELTYDHIVLSNLKKRFLEVPYILCIHRINIIGRIYKEISGVDI
jgi:hypothetical protein